MNHPRRSICIRLKWKPYTIVERRCKLAPVSARSPLRDPFAGPLLGSEVEVKAGSPRPWVSDATYQRFAFEQLGVNIAESLMASLLTYQPGCLLT